MIAFVLMQIIAAYWGGHFYDVITAYDFIFNYNMLLIPMAFICINDRSRAENILMAVGISADCIRILDEEYVKSNEVWKMFGMEAEVE